LSKWFQRFLKKELKEREAYSRYSSSAVVNNETSNQQFHMTMGCFLRVSSEKTFDMLSS
jgi:uncharacterized membrane protein